MFNNLFEFYRSDEWAQFRKIVIAERIKEDGNIYDEVTGKPIIKAYDLILHHITELTEENVFDYNISLNPKNIMVVSHKTHNMIHDKLGNTCRKIYIVYGSPLSGKTSWVRDNMSDGDLILDIDNIWQAVSGCDRYIKPKRLNAVIFKVRDTMLEAIQYRLGKWRNAYIVGGYPLISERERLCKQLGAELIFIETSKAECIKRLESIEDGRDKDEWRGYIERWFAEYTPPADE